MSPARGRAVCRAVDGRAPRRAERARPTARPLDKAIEEQPDALLGARRARALRRPAAVPDEGPRRRQAALAAGAPHERAGPGRFRRRGGRRACRATTRRAPSRTRTTSPSCCSPSRTFEALCGFRPVEESLHCLAKLQVPELKPTIAALARGGLRAAIPQLISLSPETRVGAGERRRRGGAALRGRPRPGVHQHLPLGRVAGRDLPRRPGRGHLADVQPPEAGARRGGVPARRQPARLPLRGRRRGHGQLGQRAARRADHQARRPRRADRGARLHRRAGAGPPPGPRARRAALPGAGRGLRPHPRASSTSSRAR